MRTVVATIGLLSLLFVFTGLVSAEDKPVTLEGTITCAKCDLQKAQACATVIVVKKDNKETVYYFDEKAHKEHHSKICTEAKKGKVTGVLSKKDGKDIVTVSKVEFAE